MAHPDEGKERGYLRFGYVYCEKVLDVDPENAQAYLGKLMAELKVRRRDELKNCAEPFDGSGNYQKAFRFGDASLKEQLNGCIAFINERNENARKTGIYNDAVKAMTSAHTEAQFNDAAAKFRSISGFKDADALAEECVKRAEERARVEAEKIARRKKKIIRITAPIVCVCIAFVILLTQVIIPKMKFDEAMALIATEDYDAAYAILEEIGKEEAITANKYDRAIALIDSGNFNSAYELLREIGDMATINADKYDRAIEMMHSGEYTKAYMLLKESGHGQEIDKIKYDCAMDVIAAGDYIAAYDLLHDLDYEDSAKKLEEIMPQFCRAQLMEAKVGDTVIFGSYEQDNDLSNGAEELKWTVLAKEENRVLVITLSDIESLPYNDTWEYVTWETCSLRKWLNSTFLTKAFTKDEQSLIPTVTVLAESAPGFGGNPGRNTEDRVFVLSGQEVRKYFPKKWDGGASPTKYVIAKDSDLPNDYRGNYAWWTRSPGASGGTVAFAGPDGLISIDGYWCDVSWPIGVRPALWISLD